MTNPPAQQCSGFAGQIGNACVHSGANGSDRQASNRPIEHFQPLDGMATGSIPAASTDSSIVTRVVPAAVPVTVPGIPGRRSAEWLAHKNARDRCTNPKHQQWARYGGRGIRMCAEWIGRGGFARFFEHVGRRPSPEHTLERKDVNGNYEPGNVRWATQREQCNNTRANVRLTWRGETRTIAEWADHIGLPRNTLNVRLLRGWSTQRALLTPVQPHRSRGSRAGARPC